MERVARILVKLDDSALTNEEPDADVWSDICFDLVDGKKPFDWVDMEFIEWEPEEGEEV